MAQQARLGRQIRPGRQVWLALLAVMLAARAGAQDAPAAVGRISYGDAPAAGAAICTGVLVAPDLVLTAGHCLAGAQAQPGTVRFAASLDQVSSLAVGQGAEVILSDAVISRHRANDVALLRLTRPIACDQVPTLALADPALAHVVAQFSVIAYRRDAPERPERQDDCALTDSLSGVLALSCTVVSGYSGAPLLAWDGTDWRIVAVMVAATSGGATRALASLVPPDLQARINTAAQPMACQGDVTER